MQTKYLIQSTEAAEMKERSVNHFESVCAKYKVADFDKETFVVAICFGRMDIYEFLCDKYKMSEADRNGMARSLILAAHIRNSIPMTQNKCGAIGNKRYADQRKQSNGLRKIA